MRTHSGQVTYINVYAWNTMSHKSASNCVISYNNDISVEFRVRFLKAAPQQHSFSAQIWFMGIRVCLRSEIRECFWRHLRCLFSWQEAKMFSATTIKHNKNIHVYGYLLQSTWSISVPLQVCCFMCVTKYPQNSSIKCGHVILHCCPLKTTLWHGQHLRQVG